MSEPANEREAVRTTIVGGRPPGSGRSNVTVPRGIEVLIKKAAVDEEFCQVLFAQRDGAAAAIELDLALAERAMLKAIPQDQLARIVGQTVVPLEQRRVFLGRVAAAMLAVIGVGLAGCEPEAVSLGAQPDRPVSDGIRPDRPMTKGIQPDRPAATPTNVPPPPPAGIPSNAPPPASPATNKSSEAVSRGIRPDYPIRTTGGPVSAGIQPDVAPSIPPSTNDPGKALSLQPGGPSRTATFGLSPDRP